MRLDVTGQTRIRVDPPRAADSVFPVEDGEVPKARTCQQYSQRDATGPGTDDPNRHTGLHWILRHWPPSMTSSDPVMNDAWSETRNATASATSDGWPIRPDTAVATNRAWGSAARIGVAIGPGNTALPRFPPVRVPPRRPGSGRAAPTS